MFGSLIFVHSDISILMYDAILLFTFLWNLAISVGNVRL